MSANRLNNVTVPVLIEDLEKVMRLDNFTVEGVGTYRLYSRGDGGIVFVTFKIDP